MALQTLNTIKQWFKTGLKPTQTQFWDTWDSFRHKFDKIPVKEVEGLDELLLSKADKTALDSHIADKNAHAPQVNTDWNSESGFSQLINKPEFKTINGESIVGSGDITGGEGTQDLESVLSQGDTTDKDIQFNSPNFNGFSRINGDKLYFVDNNTLANFKVDGKGLSKTSGMYGNVSLNVDRTTQGDINYNLDPNKAAGDYTIATLDDIPSGGSQDLQQVLDVGNEAIGKDFTLKDQNTNINNRIYVSPNIVSMFSEDKDFTMSLDNLGINSLNGNQSRGLRLKNTGLNFFEYAGGGRNSTLIQNTNSIGTSMVIMPLMLDGEIKTIATLDDIPTGGSQTLDQVLEQGNTATAKDIFIVDGALSTDIYPGVVWARDVTSDGNLSSGLHPGYISITNTSGSTARIYSEYLNNTLPVNIDLPRVDESLEGRNTLALSVNGIPADVNGNIVIGGGGSQNLDQVLGVGNEATLNGGTLKLLGSGKDPETSLFYPNEDNTHTTILSVTPIQAEILVDQGEGQSRLTLNKHGFALSFNGQTLVSDPNQTTTDYKQIKIPFVTEDSTLATTNDIKLKSYTVGTLPTGTIGDHAYVTDATAPTYLGSLIGGGSVVCPVFYNGTTWVSH